MSAELAAEKGVILGEPYTPPGRTGSFDVPSYDDIADLNQLFKRFANTAVANGGDTMIGTYNIAGSLYINGQPLNPSDAYALSDKDAAFTVPIVDVLAQTRYVCNFGTDMTVTMPEDGSSLPDGARITIIQAGKGKVTVNGLNVIGTQRTGSQYSTLEVMWHATKWWCLAGGGGGGGGTGTPPAPVIGFVGPNFDVISWPPVADGSAGPTIGYGALTNPSDVKYQISKTNPVNMAVSRLPGGTTVSYEVWAVNLAGRGESSNTLTHTYPTVSPTAMTGVPGGGSAVLKWSAVAGVTEWDLEWKKRSDADWNLVQDIPKGTLTYTVASLAEGIPYVFRVYAVIGAAFSEPSNTVEVIPGPSTPPPAAVLTHDADTVGKWTIANYDPLMIYTATISTGAAPVLNGNKLTTTVATADITVTVKKSAAGLPATTVVSCAPYQYPYTPGYYKCTNETYDYCDGNSGYCPCGTWHESEGSCSGWVCHEGYDVPGFYSIGGNPGGYTASSNAGATFGSIPATPPGEWFKAGA